VAEHQGEKNSEKKASISSKVVIAIMTPIIGMLIAMTITIYTVGARNTEVEKLRAIKARQDATEIRLKTIDTFELPGLKTADATIVAKLDAFKETQIEIKDDIKIILDLLQKLAK
jgi:hypothetical protein